ncbi:hypothetical protein [Bauldia litoralis]|uniref:hypothetical protein n=1 Tax=Bauldia litoralis TaxID=665467 RepID=UPI001113BB35|nr:hypothetical protein [Bauldia litoralis]
MVEAIFLPFGEVAYKAGWTLPLSDGEDCCRIETAGQNAFRVFVRPPARNREGPANIAGPSSFTTSTRK